MNTTENEVTGERNAARVTAGGFHHLDCRCDSCNELREQAPTNTTKTGERVPETRMIETKYDRLFEAIKAGSQSAMWEVARIIKQRDELLAAWKAFIDPIQDKIDSAVLAGRITPNLRQMQEAIAGLRAAIAKLQ